MHPVTTKKEPVKGPTNDQLDWHSVCELLRAKQYERVVGLLQQAQVITEETDNSILADILAAACQICLACNQSRADQVWHKQACEEARRREHILRQTLDAILSGVEGLVTGANLNFDIESEAASRIIPNPIDQDVTEARESSGFWQRIQHLFRWDVPPQLSNKPIPATPDGQEAKDRIPSDNQLEKQPEQEPSSFASLVVHCLGPFQVYQDDQPVENWPSSKGKSIFKYMVTYHKRPVAKEILMELFWPDAHPDSARNNLNVAIYGLRQALHDIRPDFSHVLFQNDCYLLNPELQIWVDVEAFREHLKTARSLERRRDLAPAMREYRAAEALYKGEFLAEDRYEDWLIPFRQSLQADYLNLLDRLSRYYLDQQEYDGCVTMCDKMLAIDPCREEAHRRLMRCYARRGQRYLALRQYQLCVETLQAEVDVSPASATTTLYEQTRQGRPI